jgi:glycerophosphoryl diester phosphodiesterase
MRKIFKSPVPLLPERKRPLVFAHRGCSSLAPENTFAAFKKARDTGAPGIELDIHVCAPEGLSAGKLVVAHDDTFKRTAGDERAIADLTYDEIKRIDVGSFFDSSFRGEHPPLIEEILEEFCPPLYVDIELKSSKTREDPLPELLADLLQKMGDRILRAVTVSSFNPFAIGTFKRLCPRTPTAVIYCADKEVPLILRHGFGRILSHCDYLKPRHTQVSAFNRFRFTALEGRPLVPWTIDDTALAEKMLKKGCEGIITNRPQDMLGLINFPETGEKL